MLAFLGFLLDTVQQIVAIPREKIEKALDLIKNVTAKRKGTVKTMQQLCGYLNFLGRSVLPGRAFTRRLYSVTQGHSKQLLPHHHVNVKSETGLDLETWKTFLEHSSVFSCSFMNFSKFWTTQEIQFYTDAAKTFSMGGFCQGSWMTHM